MFHLSSGGTEGLLFSGGLDSIHSELTSPGQKYLFTMWGADTDPNEDTPWSDIRLQTIRYADEYGHIPIFIRSNFRTFLRKQRLHTWHREISHWYTHVQHGPALIGLTAPIMILGGGHKLIIDASHWQEELRRGWGSSRSLDESAQFGDVMILHAGHDKTRQDKIKDIVNIRQNGPPREFVLRVCSKQIQGGGNCGTCEKCLRTSTGLILEGEDPRKWGFLNDPLSTMKLLKHKMQRFKLKMTDSEVRFWSAIQSRSREIQFSGDIQKYIEWLAHMNLKKQSAWYELLTGRKLYSICPKILRKLIRKVFFAFWRLNL